MESTTVEETVEVGGAPEPDRIEQAAEALHPRGGARRGCARARRAAESARQSLKKPKELGVNIGHEYKTLRRRQKNAAQEEAFQAKVSELESKLAEVEAANLINLIKKT